MAVTERWGQRARIGCALALWLMAVGCSSEGNDNDSPTPTADTETPGTATPAVSPSPSPTLPPTPSPTPPPPSRDQDQDGVIDALDCDDGDPLTYPGARELCDDGPGKDNDCDGAIDEDVNQLYFHDQDGDGFGDELDTACTFGNGYIATRGDCNDQDSSVHPGAPDPADDGIDQDCGHSDGLDPHLGFSSASQASIQAAIDLAAEGATIWVGPATYLEHDIDFHGKAVRLASTRLAGVTTLSAGKLGRVLSIASGEGAGTVLDGFTLTGGLASGNYDGGGISIVSSSPSIRNCTFVGNSSGYRGGGLALQDSSAEITNCIFTLNSADDSGGAIAVDDSSPVITGALFVENTAGFGGAIAMDHSFPAIDGGFFSGNTALEGGGALFANRSSPALTSSTFLDNSTQAAGGAAYFGNSSSDFYACGFGSNVAVLQGGAIYADAASMLSFDTGALADNRADRGGALFVSDSSLALSNARVVDNEAVDGAGVLVASAASDAAGASSLSHCLVQGNVASGSGGGVAIYGSVQYGSSLLIRNSIVVENSAVTGGGVLLDGSSPTLVNTVVAGNAAGYGGGIYLAQEWSAPVVRNSILAYNTGYNLFNLPTPPAPLTLTYSDLYSPEGADNHNLSGLEASNKTVLPGFVAVGEADGGAWDFHLAKGSALIDAGSAEVVDVDGSRSDPGAYGGPEGDGWDLDGDGYPDYFWPGTIGDAPNGYAAGTYDCRDLDAWEHGCL